jgi:hypothetical protein
VCGGTSIQNFNFISDLILLLSNFQNGNGITLLNI